MTEATAIAQQTTHQSMPLAWLVLSETHAQGERRARFDKTSLTDLASSLKAHGMLQPIVVRPRNSPGEVRYQIVAGERRFLAAKQAGLNEVPVACRELNDEQVIEIQLIENLQREGLHELIEAEGYETLMQMHHYTVENLVAKVGKSRAYVYARLKLTALCGDARKAFYAGKLNSSTALLLARIPQEQLQKQALGEITKPRWGDEIMSVRDAARHIHENYMLRLDQAGFPTGDASLVPAAGPCGACPKRTGNQPELFNDVKGADVCTDPVCFRAKREAQAVRLKAAAEAKGQTVISGQEAKKIAPHGTDSSLNGYVKLDEKCWQDSKSRKYRALLGKGFEATLLQDPDTGAIVEVASESAVKKALPSVKGNGGNTYQAQQRTADKKRKLELEYRAALARAIYAAGFKDDAEADLLLACEAMFDRLHHDARKRLFKVMAWEPVRKKRKYGGPLDTYEIEPHLKGLKESGLWKMLRVLSVSGDLEVWSNQEIRRQDRLHKLAARIGVKASEILWDLTEAAKLKAKPKAKRKGK